MPIFCYEKCVNKISSTRPFWFTHLKILQFLIDVLVLLRVLKPRLKYKVENSIQFKTKENDGKTVHLQNISVQIIISYCLTFEEVLTRWILAYFGMSCIRESFTCQSTCGYNQSDGSALYFRRSGNGKKYWIGSEMSKKFLV